MTAYERGIPIPGGIYQDWRMARDNVARPLHDTIAALVRSAEMVGSHACGVVLGRSWIDVLSAEACEFHGCDHDNGAVTVFEMPILVVENPWRLQVQSRRHAGRDGCYA